MSACFGSPSDEWFATGGAMEAKGRERQQQQSESALTFQVSNMAAPASPTPQLFVSVDRSLVMSDYVVRCATCKHC